MLIVRKANDGSYAAIAIGKLIKDATFKTLSSGKETSKFTIQYGLETDTTGGRRNGLLLVCDAWERLAEFAAALEKGDRVLVAGPYIRDDFWSAKQGKDIYKINCEIILPQPQALTGAEITEGSADELPADWVADF